MQVGNLVKLGPVQITERVMLNQVSVSKNIKLSLEQGCSLGPHAFQKLYFGIEKAGHLEVMSGEW